MTGKGYQDAALRCCTVFFAIAMPFMVLTPLMPNMTYVIPMLALMAFTKSMQQALSPVAIQLSTPNEMRAQVTSIFFVASSFPSIALGATSVALLTDFVFKDDAAIGYSLAIVGGVMMTLATIAMFTGIKPYRASLERSMEWRDDNQAASDRSA